MFGYGGSNYTGGTLNTSWNAVTQASRAVGISSFFDSTDKPSSSQELVKWGRTSRFEVEPFGVTQEKCHNIFLNYKSTLWKL